MNAWEIVGIILGSGVLSSVITVFAARRLKSSQIKSNEAQAADLLSKTYSSLIKDLNDQIQRSKNINGQQETELAKLKKTNETLTGQVETLTKEVNELRSEIETLRGYTAKLEKRLKKYEDIDN